MSWRTARSQLPGVSPSDGFTALVVALQLAICTASLLLLGKTAKEGTLWGNLAAVAGATSTRSMPTKSIVCSPRMMVCACQLLSPPQTGVPVPGA